ncbi:MAG: 8-oxo-dGTP diphosphatase [Patescibacteria group bacterium]
MRKLFTPCVVHQGPKILLGMKKVGLGAGRWNGFGGKVEPGEAIDVAAVRELREEVCIETLDIRQKGILEFSFENNPKILEVHVFEATKFSGTPAETEEMTPCWFDLAKIPYEQMWSDDIHWLPLLLAGKTFHGKFHFDQPSTANYSAKILSQELREVSTLWLSCHFYILSS